MRTLKEIRFVLITTITLKHFRLSSVTTLKTWIILINILDETHICKWMGPKDIIGPPFVLFEANKPCTEDCESVCFCSSVGCCRLYLWSTIRRLRLCALLETNIFIFFLQTWMPGRNLWWEKVFQQFFIDNSLLGRATLKISSNVKLSFIQ